MNNDKLNNLIDSYVNNLDLCANCLGKNADCAYNKGSAASLSCKESIKKYLEDDLIQVADDNCLYEDVSSVNIKNKKETHQSRRRINSLRYAKLTEKKVKEITYDEFINNLPYCRFASHYTDMDNNTLVELCYLEGTTFFVEPDASITYTTECVPCKDEYTLEELMRSLSKEDYIRYLKDKMEKI